MKIKYKIIEMYPDDGTIVVRYFSDLLPEKQLISIPDLDEKDNPLRCRTDVSINIPLPLPKFKEIDSLIWMHCPIIFFETQAKIKDETIDTTLDTLKSKFKKDSKAKTIEDIKNDNALYHSKKLKEMTMADVLTAEEIEEITKNL